jgi:hypothetical protein
MKRKGGGEHWLAYLAPRKLLCPVNALLRFYDETRIAAGSDRRATKMNEGSET